MNCPDPSDNPYIVPYWSAAGGRTTEVTANTRTGVRSVGLTTP